MTRPLAHPWKLASTALHLADLMWLDVPFFARDGGLFSFGPSYPDLFRRSAAYVDRILKGEKPADLPVQLPTKYEFVINLKTAEDAWPGYPQHPSGHSR